MKVFISQMMAGKTAEEIRKDREDAVCCVQEMYGVKRSEIEVIGSYFDTFTADKDLRHPLVYLGRAIALMAEADVVCFAPGWKKARGCRIENAAAHEYGKEILELFGA